MQKWLWHTHSSWKHSGVGWHCVVTKLLIAAWRSNPPPRCSPSRVYHNCKFYWYFIKTKLDQQCLFGDTLIIIWTGDNLIMIWTGDNLMNIFDQSILMDHPHFLRLDFRFIKTAPLLESPLNTFGSSLKQPFRFF